MTTVRLPLALEQRLEIVSKQKHNKKNNKCRFRF